MLRSPLVILLLAGMLVLSCREKAGVTVAAEASLTDVPDGFPAIPFPEENPFTIEKWELGKKLFYDKVLSVDYTVSCASCHHASIAFSDKVATSPGAGGAAGTRNAPTLANVAYHPYYTREGGVKTLEMQVLVPIQEHNEFNYNIVDIAARLTDIPEYVSMSRAAFNREPDAYVITRAIATFERTIVSANSLYDAYINNRPATFPEEAKRGMDLFFSARTQCSSCHGGIQFTDYSFKNNGLYEVYQDIGRERFTGSKEDNALFKVPTLRNIDLTAPYMHDGSLNTLEEVIEHYNSGGMQHPNKSALVRPLALDEQEKKDLVAFLQTLTDYELVTNKKFYNEDQ